MSVEERPHLGAQAAADLEASLDAGELLSRLPHPPVRAGLPVELPTIGVFGEEMKKPRPDMTQGWTYVISFSVTSSNGSTLCGSVLRKM